MSNKRKSRRKLLAFKRSIFRRRCRENAGQKIFEVGDRVRIRNFRKLFWGDRTPQEFGFVWAINGAYHYVKPRWHPAAELFEFYPGEIELANHR